jgi:hypothetical protein
MKETEMYPLTDIPFKLDVQQLAAMMRVQNGSNRAVEFERLVHRAQQIGRPKALYKVSYIDEKGADSVVIEGIRFKSRTLMKNLESVERIFPSIITCGNEMDTIEVEQCDLQKKSWISFLKGNLLMIASRYLQEHLIRKYRIIRLAYMNPGSGDASVWPIEQQRELFSLFGNVEDNIGVKLTRSFILSPDMSVSGIMFPTEVDFQSCQLCHRENCMARRAPFDERLWDSINNREIS